MQRNLTISLKTTYLKKCFFSILCGCGLFISSANAQILISLYKETYPNTYNAAYASLVNTGFTEKLGGWWALSSGNGKTAVLPSVYSPVTNALSFVMPSTTGAGAADVTVTSPVINLGNPGCNGKYDFVFKLYTNDCTSGDNSSYLAVDYSKDGGITWSLMWQQTSGQLYSWLGPNAEQDVWLALPSTYFTSGFKYRFRTHKNANTAGTFNPFVDDVTVYSYSCSDVMNLGNLVWLDMNMNGLKDATEQGVQGVTLELLRDNDGDGLNDWDFTPQTTTTDANGIYAFTNLTAGKYFVSLINVNTIYRIVPINAGEPDEDGDNNNNALTQNASFTNVSGGWITLLPQSEPTNDGDGNNGNLSYDFAIYPAALLPVRSVSLNLLYTSGETVVSWKTINEVNLLMFEVERSVDNIKFEKIASKTPSASYGGNALYSITDVTGNNFAPVVYYRIKVIDKDSKYTYSNTEAIRTKGSNEDKISVWPNPFVSEIKISHTALQATNLLVKVSDNTGRVVKTQSYKAATGLNQFTIDNMAGFASGIYTVMVYSSASNTSAVYKIIK